MYSHQNPPNRRMYINGHLSLPFPLGAGVAQGCPLSPLLFLLITEPLSRMFKRNIDLQGVTIDNIRHVISQYHGTRTTPPSYILKPGDEATVRELLRVWKKGTAMMENVAKREGLMLGALRTHPARAPDNVVGAWTPDGSTIRALGVPIGNDFNEYESPGGPASAASRSRAGTFYSRPYTMACSASGCTPWCFPPGS
jgi:hypothetical protein